jgi:hypothetical protein
MNRAVFFAAAALLIGYQAPALAQTKGKSAAPAVAAQPGSLTKEQLDHAVEDFGILSSAMRSDQVPDDVKSALMGCIYSNPLSKISSAIDQIATANPGKVDRTKPDSVLGAMAAICGYRPSPAAAGATPPAGKAPPAGAPATGGR